MLKKLYKPKMTLKEVVITLCDVICDLSWEQASREISGQAYHVKIAKKMRKLVKEMNKWGKVEHYQCGEVKDYKGTEVTVTIKGNMEEVKFAKTNCVLCHAEVGTTHAPGCNREDSDWKTTFRKFYNDNEQGGSSRWLVAPNVVELFIETELTKAREEGKREGAEKLADKITDQIIEFGDNTKDALACIEETINLWFATPEQQKNAMEGHDY